MRNPIANTAQNRPLTLGSVNQGAANAMAAQLSPAQGGYSNAPPPMMNEIPGMSNTYPQRGGGQGSGGMNTTLAMGEEGGGGGGYGGQPGTAPGLGSPYTGGGGRQPGLGGGMGPGMGVGGGGYDRGGGQGSGGMNTTLAMGEEGGGGGGYGGQPGSVQPPQGGQTSPWRISAPWNQGEPQQGSGYVDPTFGSRPDQPAAPAVPANPMAPANGDDAPRRAIGAQGEVRDNWYSPSTGGNGYGPGITGPSAPGTDGNPGVRITQPGVNGNLERMGGIPGWPTGGTQQNQPATPSAFGNGPETASPVGNAPSPADGAPATGGREYPPAKTGRFTEDMRAKRFNDAAGENWELMREYGLRGGRNTPYENYNRDQARRAETQRQQSLRPASAYDNKNDPRGTLNGDVFEGGGPAMPNFRGVTPGGLASSRPNSGMMSPQEFSDVLSAQRGSQSPSAQPTQQQGGAQTAAQPGTFTDFAGRTITEDPMPSNFDPSQWTASRTTGQLENKSTGEQIVNMSAWNQIANPTSSGNQNLGQQGVPAEGERPTNRQIHEARLSGEFRDSLNSATGYGDTSFKAAVPDRASRLADPRVPAPGAISAGSGRQTIGGQTLDPRDMNRDQLIAAAQAEGGAARTAYASPIRPVAGELITDPNNGTGSVYQPRPVGSDWGGQKGNSEYQAIVRNLLNTLRGYGDPDSKRPGLGKPSDSRRNNDGGSGSGNTGLLIPDLYQRAWDEARNANEDRYQAIKGDQVNDYGGLYRDTMDWQGRSANDLINQSGERFDRNMGYIDNYGKQSLENINDNFDSRVGSEEQALINRGLGNTTIRTGAMAGVERARSKSLGDEYERQALMRLNADSRLSGDYLAMQSGLHDQRLGLMTELPQRQLDFMERRTDSYPNMDQLLNLASRYGDAQGNLNYPGAANPGYGGNPQMPQQGGGGYYPPGGGTGGGTQPGGNNGGMAYPPTGPGNTDPPPIPPPYNGGMAYPPTGPENTDPPPVPPPYDGYGPYNPPAGQPVPGTDLTIPQFSLGQPGGKPYNPAEGPLRDSGNPAGGSMIASVNPTMKIEGDGESANEVIDYANTWTKIDSDTRKEIVAKYKAFFPEKPSASPEEYMRWGEDMGYIRITRS